MDHLPWILAALIVSAGSACVPADEAIPLGSSEFRVTGATAENRVFSSSDDWEIRIDRALLSFKTMTIGKVGAPDQCAYRGRGARANLVFEAAGAFVQSFNGILPGTCPDVGLILGPPDNRTVLGPGATPEDLFALAADRPAHTIIEATARRKSGAQPRAVRLRLRFDAETTSSQFGGCRDATRGVRIDPEERYLVDVSFSAQALFRDGIAPGARVRFAPFVGPVTTDSDSDGTITMQELDALPLSSVRATYGAYPLPSGSLGRSFGDYVRSQFRFTFSYGRGGLCTGNEPGSETK